MYFRFSSLDCKQERSFAKWIEERCKEVDAIARERLSMDRRSLDYQKKELRSLVALYKPLKKYRKIDDMYDLKIRIDKNGYVNFDVVFPVTRAERELAGENRRKAIEELNADGFKFGGACVRIEEEVWEVIKDRVKKEFPMLDPETIHLHIDMQVNWSR